jgi:3-dehydroshikimate dehydratase
VKVSLCSISFRHHLISIEQLARFAQQHGFHGIELWGPHARHLSSEREYDAAWLRSFGLEISMLSDYLPLDGTVDELRAKVEALSELALRWGTTKVRTFAGKLGSAAVVAEERRKIVDRLRAACDWMQPWGLRLLIETHPHTLADTTASTLELLAEVAHPRLKVNFDVLHLWEAGDEPAHALALLRKYVAHYHLKNVKGREFLSSFSPANVYAPSGSRAGMEPLFEGAFDYRRFLGGLASDERVEASLEWFGDDVKRTLVHDLSTIRKLPAREPRIRTNGIETPEGAGR